MFDFDHTITDLNTDVEVQKLAPGGEIPARFTLCFKTRLEIKLIAVPKCGGSTQTKAGQSSWAPFLTCCTRWGIIEQKNTQVLTRMRERSRRSST